MRLKRKSTNARVNEILSKGEPTYGFLELSNIEMGTALNWYNQYSDKDTSHKFLSQYCESHGVEATPQQIAQQVPTMGFVCRMLMRGAVLNTKSMAWLAAHLKAMIELVPESQTVSPQVAPKPKPTIQDHLKQKAGVSIGILEGAIDSFILSDFKKVPDTLKVLRENEIKAAHGPHIINWAKRNRDEYRLALQGTDPQVSEAYSNYSHPELKKMDTLYDQIISDTLSVMGETKVAKAPRAKKPKTPEKQVKSLKFCPSDKELHLQSVAPTKIIGADGLWCYNRVTRMLTCYMADDASGLGIKGCTVLNYSKEKTRAKKLRKPDVTLPQVLSGGKVALRKLFDELTTKDAKVTGRINKDTVLVRVV